MAETEALCPFVLELDAAADGLRALLDRLLDLLEQLRARKAKERQRELMRELSPAEKVRLRNNLRQLQRILGLGIDVDTTAWARGKKSWREWEELVAEARRKDAEKAKAHSFDYSAGKEGRAGGYTFTWKVGKR